MAQDGSLGPVPLLVSEILDPQTQTLVAAIDNSDYVMSNDIVSAAIAQVSENRVLNRVINELLSSNGCELYMKPARRYATHNERLCFWDIMARARNLNEVSPRLSHAVRLNSKPPTSSEHMGNEAEVNKMEHGNHNRAIRVVM